MVVRFTSLVLVVAAFAGFAFADCDWPDEKDPVKVTVAVILASEKGNFIHPKLKHVAAEVQKLHPNLKSFALGREMSKSLRPNEKTALNCVEGQAVDITIKHGADKENRVSLTIVAPMMSSLEYQSVCGKFLPIVTPFKTKKGETLILAIRVEPCQGK